jgi:hypothetical protein
MCDRHHLYGNDQGPEDEENVEEEEVHHGSLHHDEMRLGVRRCICLILVGIVTLTACGESRVRNVATPVGTACSKLGEVKKMSGIQVACTKADKGSAVAATWQALSGGTPAKGRCTKKGTVRSFASQPYVCALRQGKLRWQGLVRSPQTSAATPATTSIVSDSTVQSIGGGAEEQARTSGDIASNPEALEALPVLQTTRPADPVIETMEWDEPVVVWSIDKRTTLEPARIASGRAITYSIADDGGTGCRLDGNSLDLEYRSPGYCYVRASAAATTGYAESSAVLVVAIDVACRYGQRCELGDIGPGGGVVVHVAATPQKWGTYVEAAPASWASGVTAFPAENFVASAPGEPVSPLCQSGRTFPVGGTLGRDIGAGKANTAALDTAGCALAKTVRALTINGQGDWLIPSSGDLEAMCAFLKSGQNRVNCADLESDNRMGMAGSLYWSSTSESSTGWAFFRRFRLTTSTASSAPPTTPLWVRPVRYFGLQEQGNISVYPTTLNFGLPTKLIALGGSGTGQFSVELVDAGTAGCRLSGDQVVSDKTGTCVVRASKSASEGYVATTGRPVTLTIVKSQPSLFLYGGTGRAGVNQVGIGVRLYTAYEVKDVRYEIVDQGTTGCSMRGNTVVAPNVGTCTVKAKIDGSEYFNASESRVEAFLFLESCETGGECYPGDVGPGGGRIFFITGPRSWFTDFLTGQVRRYMEVAPANWATTIPGGKTADIWGCASVQMSDADLPHPGGGSKNSAEFLAQCSGQNNVFARVAAYRGGGFSDWYVPSQVELNELCKYARGQRLVGDVSRVCSADGSLSAEFEPGLYWSSTQNGKDLARAQLFGPSQLLPDLTVGVQTPLRKTVVAMVRPIRNFCAGWCPKLNG